MAVYQDKAKERIHKGLRRFRNVVKKAAENNSNEADTRVIVNAILSELLGWDKFEDITGEHRIRGQYADFVIKMDSGLFAIIEVKVILTNGDEWRCYRVLFNKPVDKDLVFSVRISDPDMKPKAKAELLYLLSAEAQRKTELAVFYDYQAAMCGSNLGAALLSDRVITALRAEVRAQTGHRPTKEDLAVALIERVVCPEAQASVARRAVTANQRIEQTRI